MAITSSPERVLPFTRTIPGTPAGSGVVTMRANVFVGPNKIEIREVPRPRAGPGEAVIRLTLTDRKSVV